MVVAADTWGGGWGRRGEEGDVGLKFWEVVRMGEGEGVEAEVRRKGWGKGRWPTLAMYRDHLAPIQNRG